jgi:hypothetical protein
MIELRKKLLEICPTLTDEALTEDAIVKLIIARDTYEVMKDSKFKKAFLSDNETGKKLRIFYKIAKNFLDEYNQNTKIPRVADLLVKACSLGHEQIEKEIGFAPPPPNIYGSIKSLLVGLETYTPTKLLMLKEGRGKCEGSGDQNRSKFVEDVFNALCPILQRPPTRLEMTKICEIMGFGKMTEQIKKYRKSKGLHDLPGRKKKK